MEATGSSSPLMVLLALCFMEAGVSPDVILLDMHMAGVDGWRLAAELHAQRETTLSSSSR